ncbi:hypothetical protein [Rickettsia argasii]|nr:hypothetical protein [Rickettsia argasii]
MSKAHVLQECLSSDQTIYVDNDFLRLENLLVFGGTSSLVTKVASVPSKLKR